MTLLLGAQIGSVNQVPGPVDYPCVLVYHSYTEKRDCHITVSTQEEAIEELEKVKKLAEKSECFVLGFYRQSHYEAAVYPDLYNKTLE
jgi:hypothetical protein